MVTIVDFKKVHSESGRDYIRLIVQSDDLSIVTTDEGRTYVSAPKSSVISSFSVAMAKSQIGKKLPGTIEQVKCEPWTYVDKETGEQKIYNSRYSYIPENKEEVEEEALA